MQLRLQLDAGSRSLARIIAAIERRGLAVVDVRYTPSGLGRPRCEAVLRLDGPPPLARSIGERLRQMPGVLAVTVDLPAAALSR